MIMVRFSSGKQRGILLTVFIVLALVLQGCGAEGKGSNEQNSGAANTTANVESSTSNIPKVLNYGFIGSNELNLPGGAEGWGLYKGIIQEELKKHGIEEIVLTGFPNGPDQTESLISGRIDFGSLGDTPAIIAYASGAKTRLINQTTITNTAYLLTTADGPKTIEELAGKTISIQKGSYMHRYVVGLLNEAGVKDYKLVHMLSPDGQAALARGDVEAMTNSGFPANKLIADGYYLIDTSKEHPHLHGTSTTVVSEAYLEKFPEFPKVWNEARQKALEDLKQHEEEYYQFVADLNKTTVELAKKVSPISEISEVPFVEEGIERITGTKDFLVEEGLAKKDYKIEDWVLKVE